MLVGGALTASPRTFGVVDPATGEEFDRAPDCDDTTLDAAVRAANDAWPVWRADAGARRACLAAAAAALREAAGELAPILTAEQGKPLRDAENEVARAAARFQHLADLEIAPDVMPGTGGERVEVHWRPVGPVAAIAPWNFPLQLGAAKVAPALAAGCTVVLKPSPHTPLATLAMGRVLAGIFPPGVLNVVAGADPLGERLAAHPGIRKINFTGSAATGRHVAATAAPDLKRLTLELGGNDAAIVLDDADVDAVAEGLFWSAFANCGQICMAVKRVYAPAALHDDLVGALAERAAKAVVGDGMDPATQIGPIANRPQYERVRGLVAEALAGGARAAVGGAPLDRPGFFFAPTVLAGAEAGMRIVDEEQFGPALPVVRYRDVDEAVALANATPYGLCGSVWGADTGRAAAVAARLDCGTAWVNGHMRMSLDEPFGGTKHSGLGVSGGPWGVRAHCEPFVLHVPAP
ncbi:aldehyde dehydrogenase family protein [Actinomadura sp. NPDC048394]|jgi:acyl-CoA reductase-like NAD-dependent aldehyde dehydrogenase|uniref:aldehyde dehydrogenase family protein n=1 Tax=Actinomadura sp. NPDC048394 TaxID=3158223 RepID=UPI0033DAA8C7